MDTYEGLQFSYANTKRELESMQELVGPFLEDGSKWVLKKCATDLENARSTRGIAAWRINKEAPLKTRPSVGSYRASPKNAGISVRGELYFIWEINNPDLSRRRQNDFVLNGLASTSIIIKATENDEVVARWQIEAGDASSPGCHFHSAVNQYVANGLFPEWLKIPRFPGFLLSPLDGLEFLVSELFQDEWLEHVCRSSHARNYWASAQQHRLSRILNWQLQHLSESDTTPWMSLKKAKPDLNLLSSN